MSIGRSRGTGGTVYYGHRRVYDVRSRSHITGGTICYWHRLCMLRDHTSQRVRFVKRRRRVFVVRLHITGGGGGYDLLRASALSVVRSHITGGSICYGHRRWVCCEHMPVVYDLLRASACACWRYRAQALRCFQTQTFNAFNLQTLPTYKPFKLPNSQTLKMSSIRTPRLFNPPKFETFRAFKV